MRKSTRLFLEQSGIQIAIQTGANASDEDLQFFQQLGVEWAMVGIDDPTQHSAEYYKHLVKRFGDRGIKIYRIATIVSIMFRKSRLICQVEMKSRRI